MVTDRQVIRLRQCLAAQQTLERAALKSSMDEKSARKYRQGKTPTERAAPHTWRTRPDPFADVWPQVHEQLKRNPNLQAKTLFAWLQREHPGRFADGQRRTFERGVSRWKAAHGSPQEVFFRQEHRPGQTLASDFTHATDLGVTIQGVPLEHLWYHAVLTYSNWESVTLCFSECFEALSEGLQNALWELGGVPARHRSDSLSAAVNNLSDTKEFTARYAALLAHVGMKGERTNAGCPNENGDVESSHRHFKETLDQELMLRGSRDFASREEYERFVREVVRRRNSGRGARVQEEIALLKALPARRLESGQRLHATVDSGSLIHVLHNVYSVNSRLRGREVEVRVYAEHLEVWLGGELLERLPRLRGRGKSHVNYRHVIDSLVRKPGAFAHYVYREEMFPTSRFRMAYDQLSEGFSVRRAAREYLEILHLAAREGESLVDEALRVLLDQEQPIRLGAVQERLASQAPASPITALGLSPTDLSVFDQLLPNKEVWDEPTCQQAAPPDAWRDQPLAADPSGTGALSEGIGAADLSDGLRGDGPPRRAADDELRAVSLGVGAAGVSEPASQADRAATAPIAAAVGEEPGELSTGAIADEGGPPGEEPRGRNVCRSAGEPAGVRSQWNGEDAPVSGDLAGVGAAGAVGALQSVQPIGAGASGRQARPEAGASDQAMVPPCGVGDRRPGLCAAEPGGDGGALHPLGRALRARNGDAHEQSAVLEVGADLQGPVDDGGGDRPPGASQRDPGADQSKLSPGGGRQSAAVRVSDNGELTATAPGNPIVAKEEK